MQVIDDRDEGEEGENKGEWNNSAERLSHVKVSVKSES